MPRRLAQGAAAPARPAPRRVEKASGVRPGNVSRAKTPSIAVPSAFSARKPLRPASTALVCNAPKTGIAKQAFGAVATSARPAQRTMPITAVIAARCAPVRARRYAFRAFARPAERTKTARLRHRTATRRAPAKVASKTRTASLAIGATWAAARRAAMRIRTTVVRLALFVRARPRRCVLRGCAEPVRSTRIASKASGVTTEAAWPVRIPMQATAAPRVRAVRGHRCPGVSRALVRSAVTTRTATLGIGATPEPALSAPTATTITAVPRVRPAPGPRRSVWPAPAPRARQTVTALRDRGATRELVRCARPTTRITAAPLARRAPEPRRLSASTALAGNA